jgi:RND family efflux transporter MFP subunit
MMKKIKNFLWGKKWIVAALVVVIAGYFWWTNRQAADEKVALVRPEFRDITEVLTVSGRVDAEEKARMTFAAPSRLTWLPIKEGDRVSKWQGLAQVDARTLKNQMQIAQNTHGKTFRVYENVLDSVDYYAADGLTEEERRAAESAQLDIRNSALTVESADIAVKLAYMSSPINGIVTQIDQKNVGAVMLPTDTIQIVNPNTIFFVAVVDEEDITKVSLAQPSLIRLDAFDDQEFDSTVRRIAFTPTVSETGGTGYQIWLTLPVDNSGMTYRLGMNGEVDIILNRQSEVLTVPIDALIQREGKEYVDVSRNGQIERIEVTTGIADEDYIEIQSGLNPDDLVVVPTS